MRNAPAPRRALHSIWLRRLRRAALPAAGILAVGVVLAACGGPSTPGVATGSTTTSTSAASSSTGGTQGTGLLAYATCMRSHGIANFPEPGGSGGFNKRLIVSALESVSAATATRAQNDCSHVLPPGEDLGGQTLKPVTVQDQRYYLRAVACMRTHGFPTFPDPIFSGGGVSLPPMPSINTQSSQYTQAQQLCTQLIPKGLPDSGQGR
jgi:hypothetical protein